MKKVFLLLMVVSWQVSFAQEYDFPGYTWSSYGDPKENGSYITLVTATRTTDYDFFPEARKLSSIAGPEVQSAPFLAHRPKHVYWVTTYDDTSKALFFVRGLDRKTAADYEFRVLLNGNEALVPWSDITQFTRGDYLQTGDFTGKTELAYLGGYKAGLNNYLVVDLRKKSSDSIVCYTIVGWKSVHPVLLNIYTADELNDFLKKLSQPHSSNSLILNKEEKQKWKQRYPADQLDSLDSLPKKLILRAGENNLVFYLRADIIRKDQLEYQLIKDGAIYTDWKENDFDNPFIWLKNLPPGSYQLNMRYPVQREHVTSYPFEIGKTWTQTTGFKLLSSTLIGAFFGFIWVSFLNRRQRRKLQLEQQKKEKAETEMRVVRAQLNPHFVFNALGSIQGLINKSELDDANRYLADFAVLMREVLDGNYRPMNEMGREIKTLDSYLKLEQLRFNFVYQIVVDETIDMAGVQLPTLLLQPLVENAVKHGVSVMQEKGRIELSFRRGAGKDLEVWIADNGQGFGEGGGAVVCGPDIAVVAGAGEGGYGLKLTRERIALINEAYIETPVLMEIRSDAGTWVHLTFKNWLA